MARAIGVMLIVLGLVGLLYGGFSYVRHEKIVDIGPIQATRTETKTLPLPPVAGAIMLVAGVVLVMRRQA